MSDSTLRAAVIQMVSGADVKENLDTAASLVAAAARDGARLVALPEFFPVISLNEEDRVALREEFGSGPLQDFLAGLARRHGVWVIGGTIPIASDEAHRVYNTCLVYDEQGECRARYDKIHLFDVYVDAERKEQYNESAALKPGSRRVVAKTPFGGIGLSVCYDLRFPELYRHMLDEDMVMISVPSAFTERTGRRHWEMLLRARAVENLSYVIAPAQGGRHNERRTTWGHSMIVDPWGDVLCRVETGPGYACADLDFERQAQLRRSFPALDHRRPDVA